MKRVALALAFTMHLGMTSAGASAAREEVVLRCLERLACEIEDNFDGTNETQDVDWVSWTQDGFFGAMTTNHAEQTLYRRAFECVIDQFATNDWQSSSPFASPIPRQEIARIALCQIRDMSYTNAVPALQRWALNPKAPYRDDALSLYFGWAKLSREMLAVANSILANADSSTRDERIETFMGVVARINDYISGADKDVCYSNAVHMLYQNRIANVDCAVGLDGFFVSQMPGYDLSSNRLDTAIGWLESTNCISDVRSFCTSVTNQLMSAPQPLPEVEALRGL